MDRLDFYRKYLQEFLTNYSSYGRKNPEIETQLTFDTVTDQYLLFRTGWDNQRRIHNCIFHFDIKDDKIWIQENNTDTALSSNMQYAISLKRG